MGAEKLPPLVTQEDVDACFPEDREADLLGLRVAHERPPVPVTSLPPDSVSVYLDPLTNPRPEKGLEGETLDGFLGRSLLMDIEPSLEGLPPVFFPAVPPYDGELIFDEVPNVDPEWDLAPEESRLPAFGNARQSVLLGALVLFFARILMRTPQGVALGMALNIASPVAPRHQLQID